MPRTVITAITDAEQRAAAAGIWAAARRAGGRTPAPGRQERIAEKLASSDVALLATYGDKPAGMIVAEPYLEDDVVDPTCGHISMVFVEPGYWGSGIGGALVRALQAPPAGQAWTRLSVWTRDDNRRALRLYDSCGFVDTGDRVTLHEGDQINRLEWRASAAG
ncbi:MULTISPECIES: GNAT family N-acetyltransferase [Nocardioides]|uniref:GNAT family N-acetyltransferase n=1 Tax=Nocardioides TaxID=1839 RepID=UPI00032FEDC1|nr:MULTISPECIES: GNAT family N-acetyltransferase [Nocardioides]EON23376.1 acetyltransferase [Nocardioides sp. CF8]